MQDIESLINTPTNWNEKRLGEIAQTSSGGTPSRRNASFYQGSIPWVKSGELNSNIILNTSEKISEEALQSSSAKIFPKGTLLLAMYGATIGKVAILGIDAATNQAICGIRENSGFHTSYLYWYLLYCKPKLISQGIGGAQPNIGQNIIQNLSVPLPPLPEQKRIVVKIEALFAELDKGVAQLKTLKEQLKTYRQAVLKAAFEGRLTNADVPEGELPDGWESIELGQLISKPKYGSSKKCNYNVTETPVLRIPNIGAGAIDHSDLKYAEFDEKEKTGLELCQGDLLTIRSNGSVDLVGKCALITSADTHCLYAGYLIRLRPISAKLNSKYLLHTLRSGSLREQIESKAKSTSGVNNINSGELQSLKINLCSVEEQKEVVKRVETRLSVADQMEQSIDYSLRSAETLKQSILKKAFEGRLVK